MVRNIFSQRLYRNPDDQTASAVNHPTSRLWDQYARYYTSLGCVARSLKKGLSASIPVNRPQIWPIYYSPPAILLREQFLGTELHLNE